jgi:hypothetical protein
MTQNNYSQKKLTLQGTLVFRCFTEKLLRKTVSVSTDLSNDLESTINYINHQQVQ